MAYALLWLTRVVMASPQPNLPFSRHIFAIWALAGTGLCLVACGDGVGQPIREAVVTPPAGNGDVPDNAYCEDVRAWSESDATEELGLFSVLETLRAFALNCDGVGFGMRPPSDPPSQAPLISLSPELRCSARRHSRDMVQRGYFDVTTPEGEAPETRMRLAGYWSSVLLEAIAMDQPQIYAVLQGLQGGATACEGLLDPRVVAVGVGKFENLWTIDLGGARTP